MYDLFYFYMSTNVDAYQAESIHLLYQVHYRSQYHSKTSCIVLGHLQMVIDGITDCDKVVCNYNYNCLRESNRRLI